MASTKFAYAIDLTDDRLHGYIINTQDCLTITVKASKKYQNQFSVNVYDLAEPDLLESPQPFVTAIQDTRIAPKYWHGRITYRRHKYLDHNDYKVRKHTVPFLDHIVHDYFHLDLKRLTASYQMLNRLFATKNWQQHLEEMWQKTSI